MSQYVLGNSQKAIYLVTPDMTNLLAVHHNPLDKRPKRKEPINESCGTGRVVLPMTLISCLWSFPFDEWTFSHLRWHLSLEIHVIRHVVDDLPFLARSTQVQRSPRGICRSSMYFQDQRSPRRAMVSWVSGEALLQHLVIRGNEWTFHAYFP